MTAAFGVGAVLQAVYFVLVARSLGAEDFGALAAALALVAVLVPFATWGAGNMLVMEVAREPRLFPSAFGNALVALFVSASVLVAGAVVVGATVLSVVPLAAITLLAIADLGFARLADVSLQSFQAFDQVKTMAFISLLVPGARCAAAVLFVTAFSGGIVTWAWLYLVSAAAAGALALLVVVRRLARPKPEWGDLSRRMRLGGAFAVSASASTIYSDIDRVMLARLGSLDATGIYAAAYRAAAMGYLPIMALLTVTYSSFFRAGEEGVRGSSAYARRLLVPSAAYGVVAGLALYVLAPFAETILGADYGESVEALRWLAPMPLLVVLCYLPGDALTGANWQGRRTIIQLAAAGFNIALNAVLIPSYSWRGAAWATLATLTFLAALLWVTVIWLERSERSSLVSPVGAG